MNVPVYIPLGRKASKTVGKTWDYFPLVKGWAKPNYRGVGPTGHPYVGLRADGLVIVDTDDKHAADRWAREHEQDIQTATVKTQRGYHFYYQWTEGSPTGPAVGVMEKVDIRAGSGSFVVAPPTEGYRVINGESVLRPFNPAWLPEKAVPVLTESEEGWDEIPAGERNGRLTALGGSMRRQGMSYEAILTSLLALNRLFANPQLDGREIERIARSVSGYDPDPDVDFIEFPIEEIDTEDTEPFDPEARWLDSRKMTLPPPPEWWWRPYVPKGRLVLLEGAEGIGKGMMAVWLSVHFTQGRPLPGAAHEMTRAPVLWFSAEDDPQEDILRRLYAAGYDPEVDAPVIFWNRRTSRPRWPADRDELKRIVSALKPGLVILDPGRSFLAPPHDMVGDSGFNNEAAVRPGLEELQGIAHDTGTTLLFVHHWNKMSNGDTRSRSSGSGSFRQVVRHVLAVAEVGDRRALSVEKSNIAEKLGNVVGYSTVAHDELESAYFVLGERDQTVAGLEEWINARKEEDTERREQIEFPVSTEDVVHFYADWPYGAVAPLSRKMMEDLQIDQTVVRVLMRNLRAEGVIGGTREQPIWTYGAKP